MKNCISLALSGGGARGFSHIGVIKTLAKEGIAIREVAGTSMGAVVGAYYAVHGEVDGLEEFARKLDPARTLLFIDIGYPRSSLIKGERLRKQFEKWFGEARIEDARIPLAIAATELRSGKGVIFRKGRIVDALMASAAIPGLLPPVKIDGSHYVDGGVALLMPSQALRLRGTLKVGVGLPLLPRAHWQNEPAIIETLTLIYAAGKRQDEAHLRRQMRGGALIVPETGTIQDTLNFAKSKEYIRAGERAAKEKMKAIRRRLGHT